jgi:uncharacterized protein (TIGR02611 family)
VSESSAGRSRASEPAKSNGAPSAPPGSDGARSGAPESPTPGSGDADPSAGSKPPKLVQRLRERRAAYQRRGNAYRVAWVTAGVIVVVAGLVMVVFPGPALVVIPIGLAMLSLEFVWAERLLDTTLERGIDAKDLALNASRRQKIVGVAAIVCAIAAAVAVAVIYFL